jgi:hypothetical protein
MGRLIPLWSVLLLLVWVESTILWGSKLNFYWHGVKEGLNELKTEMKDSEQRQYKNMK